MKLDLVFSADGVGSMKVANETWLDRLGTRLGWRKPGGEWVMESGVVAGVKAVGGGFELAYRFSVGVKASLVCRRVDEGMWQVTGGLVHEGKEAVELARFHCLHGLMKRELGLLAPSPHSGSGALMRKGTSQPSVVESCEKSWGAAFVYWPRMKDPIHMEVDWAAAMDVGALIPGWGEPGLVFGFTAPAAAFGEVAMRTRVGEDDAFAAILLDGIRMDPGESRTMDALLIRAGDWQDGLREWAAVCAREIGARPVRPPLVGYCSWYQVYTSVKPEHMERATREFADWPVAPGGRLVQIDDGFQIMPGDWRPVTRFRDCWADLPKQIAATGSIPGLWLAPTTILNRHPVATDHPDWLQRHADGKQAMTFSNWGWCSDAKWGWGQPGDPTYYLDPDHPEARRFMFKIVNEAVEAGWTYLKLDFTYAVSTDRKPYDPKKTRLQTLRDMYRLFREAAGPDTVICACIGEMGRYALGYVDTARLGGDIGHSWNSVLSNLPDMLLRMCTNGLWWNVDPDVFLMRREGLTMTDEEMSLLCNTIGLIGGVFLTSDFASQWSPKAKELIRRFWNEKGPQIPASFKVVYAPDGMAQAIRFSYAGDSAVKHRVALYNWSEQDASTRLPLEVLGLTGARGLKVLNSEEGPAKLERGQLTLEQQPGHSLRIVELG